MNCYSSLQLLIKRSHEKKNNTKPQVTMKYDRSTSHVLAMAAYVFSSSCFILITWLLMTVDLSLTEVGQAPDLNN